jgi:hypothetical protein
VNNKCPVTALFNINGTPSAPGIPANVIARYFSINQNGDIVFCSMFKGIACHYHRLRACLPASVNSFLNHWFTPCGFSASVLKKKPPPDNI